VPAPVLVTGATGTVGSRVVSALTKAGVPVRAAARTPPPRTDDLVEPVRFDFHDPTTFAAALAGVRTLFLVRPPALARLQDLEPALRAGVAAGLTHVVLLSVQGAERLPVLPHARLERWLRSSSLRWTFLRPSFFDQNLVTVHGAAIRRRDEISVPAGRGRTAFVDAHDVGDVAAQVLLDPARHAGRAYTLTGSEALTYGEVAGIMTAVLGRSVRYTQPGLLAYVARAGRHDGLPPALVAATSVIYTTARLGLAAGLTDDTGRLLERPPVTMTQFVTRVRDQLLPDDGLPGA
jgi:uncharacterized protein YbjT (DUF2867 family)